MLYARDERNLDRMAAALQELGVTLRDAPADVPFDTDYGPLDILGEATGMRPYEAIRADAKTEEAWGVLVRVASTDDLIRMKRAAGRSKDKLMAEELIAIAEDQRRSAKGEKERPS